MLGTLNHSPLRQTKSKAHRNQRVGRASFETLEDRRLMSFTPAVNYQIGEVGAGPQAVVTADFNNDGRLDLATANPGRHSVSVLLGDGAGGFGAAIDSAGATNDAFERASVTVADFNNDGDLDLATAMYGYQDGLFGRLDVRLGNGDGTFRSPTLVSPTLVRGGALLAVAAGDFNNDGKSDLVYTADYTADFNLEEGLVQVLLGNGLGGFTTSEWGNTSNYAAGLAVGDLNGDGNLDAVVVAGPFGSDGAAFLGDGTGRLLHKSSFYSTSSLPAAALAVGDFTGDGIPDLVVSGGAVETFIGLGDGTFGRPIVHSANGYDHTGAALGDFNGDDKPDVVTSDGDAGTVSLLLGNGDGTLRYVGASAAGSSPSAVAVGDFNGDGRPDVAAANADSYNVSVLLNDGGVVVAPPPSVRIGDATVTEGNAVTRYASFTVTLSAPSTQPVTVRYATSDGTAAAASDYQGSAGSLTFAPGQTTATIAVSLTGDRLAEPNETFSVRLIDPTNAWIADDAGVGTILDDEPRLAINYASVTEGKGGTTVMTFTVTLSAAYDQAVTVNFATGNGTATGGEDYVARSGTLTFAPGETVKTITITVKGDKKREADEYFDVLLGTVSGNALIVDGAGPGTIFNDD